MVLVSSSLWIKDQWKDGYMSIEQTNNIKGIFAILILLSHSVTFIHVDGPLNELYLIARRYFNQTVVVMFLFYSGYGMTESFKRKRVPYIRSMFRRRILPLYLKFLISLILYIVVNACFLELPSRDTLVQALFGLTDIGNYGWYMLDIVLLYIFFVVAFYSGSLFRNTRVGYLASASVLTLFTVLLILILRCYAYKGSWFYNTVLLFPAGVWYSFLKNRIDVLLEDKVRYILSCVATVLVYILCSMRSKYSLIFYLMWFCVFAGIVVLISMRVRIRSRILGFFGGLVFPLFLIQGITYISLSHFGINESYPYLFVISAFFINVGLAALFEKATSPISRVTAIGTK